MSEPPMVERWTDALKAACSDTCAEMGEPSCWEVDAFLDPDNPDRGTICAECKAHVTGDIDRASPTHVAAQRHYARGARAQRIGLPRDHDVSEWFRRGWDDAHDGKAPSQDKLEG